MANRTLAGIVLVAGEKILLVLSGKGAKAGRLRWSIPKGKYKAGCDPGLFETAARELREESGIDLARFGSRGISETDCVGRGTLSYSRNGRSIELHYFVILCRSVLLDSAITAGEPMAGIGFFDRPIAESLIAPEQRSILEIFLPGPA